MVNKIALLLFTTSVLLTSFVAMSVPQASALTKSTLDENIYTTSFGNTLVCGDHKCAPGEHTKWVNAVWHSQKVSYGKVTNATHGEDVMQELVGSSTYHGSDKNSTMNMGTK